MYSTSGAIAMRGKWATLYIVSFVTLLAREVMESEMVDNTIVDLVNQIFLGLSCPPRLVENDGA